MPRVISHPTIRVGHLVADNAGAPDRLARGWSLAATRVGDNARTTPFTRSSSEIYPGGLSAALPLDGPGHIGEGLPSPLDRGRWVIVGPQGTMSSREMRVTRRLAARVSEVVTGAGSVGAREDLIVKHRLQQRLQGELDHVDVIAEELAGLQTQPRTAGSTPRPADWRNAHSLNSSRRSPFTPAESTRAPQPDTRADRCCASPYGLGFATTGDFCNRPKPAASGARPLDADMFPTIRLRITATAMSAYATLPLEPGIPKVDLERDSTPPSRAGCNRAPRWWQCPQPGRCRRTSVRPSSRAGSATPARWRRCA